MRANKPIVTSREAWDASFLAVLSSSIRDAFLREAVVSVVPANTAIYHAYGPPKMALIHHGLARVKVVSVEGREATIRYAGGGQVIGLPSVLANGSPFGADAVTDCEVSMLNTTLAQRLGRANAEIAWLFAQRTAEISYETIENLGINLFGTVMQRVSRHLLDLASEHAEGLVVEVDQQEIANSIGSVREVVARSLRTLKEHGLIERAPAGLRLLHPDQLRRIADSTDTLH